MSDVTTTSSNVKLEPATDDANINLDPKDSDFDEDIGEEEKEYYKEKYKDLNEIKHSKLHCTACDKHLGCAPRSESRMRPHPMLRTLVCHTCHTFYNSGEFEKGDDGSELYCRWCGQGGQVYCCADCPHVFCAKCIKRNLGASKIKEIETTDDWKCFKCAPKCLWDLRSLCWALLRYCDLKNKLAYTTEDPELKEKYQKSCTVDDSECCREKKKRQSLINRKKEEKKDEKKEEKKEIDEVAKKAAAVISKIPGSIQIKKFALINDSPEKKNEKRKRPASPVKNKVTFKNPNTTYPAIRPCPPPQPKKMKFNNQQPILVQNPFRILEGRPGNIIQYNRPVIRPRMPLPVNTFNGFNAMIPNDNINLSLESLTQGLDMAAVAALAATSTNNCDDDVVCTPDFPMEPLCEVNEDTNDDDVQCMTPGPIAAPKVSAPPLLASKPSHNLPEITPDNIIQMTENDVTVNAVTGGLKFRVDPQTLSSNKMYRLPDGRIFAINANPNMPGGYSATIVSVTDPNLLGKTTPGKTFAAKLSAVTSQQATTPQSQKAWRKDSKNKKSSTPKTRSSTRVTRSTTKDRNVDMKVPVEWYRYNVVDAVDALEYSLNRLQQLKKDATTVHLRSRSLDEMRSLHRTLDRLLNNSASRFNEIRDNLNQGFREYLSKKEKSTPEDDDDDDVEILSNDLDEPICVDENSCDSNTANDKDVHLVSDHNDSGEKEDNKLKPDNDINNISSEGEDNTLKPENELNSIISEKEHNTMKPENMLNSIISEKEDNTMKPENDLNDNSAEKLNDSTDTGKSEDLVTQEQDIAEIVGDTNEKSKEVVTKKDMNQVNSDTNMKDTEEDKSELSSDNDEEKEEETLNTNNCDSEAVNDKKNDDIDDKDNEEIEEKDINEESHEMMDTEEDEMDPLLTNNDKNVDDKIRDNLDEELEDKMHDNDISDEIIESLLKDDSPDDATDEIQKVPCLETLQENSSILSN